MFAYILRRLALIPVTLLGIIALNFLIVQVAPGGPVERVLAEIRGLDVGATDAFTGGGSETVRSGGTSNNSAYRGAQGLDPEFIKEIERQFGFDKPAHERFILMVANYAQFDLGESFYRSIDVTDLIIEKMPVSISLGLWSTLIIYLVSIPLGISKAIRDGTRFDVSTSYMVVIGYAVPGFMFAILLIVLFAGGSYFHWFPLRGLTSDNWEALNAWGKITDYLWHLTLPVTAMVVGGFASLTMLTKNSFLDEINKQYVLTAKAKGLTENRILYGHVFRNAMLIVIAGFPSTIVNMLFTGALLIEVIFSLDGLGLLGFQAIIDRDYPVIFGTLFIFSLLGLVLNIISDITYHVVDPRIDFETRENMMAALKSWAQSPLTQRRLTNFKANGRGLWSLWIITALFILTLGAEFIANDRPLVVSFKGKLYAPVIVDYPETAFGGVFETSADYTDPFLIDLIEAEGWIVEPLIPYSFDTIDFNLGRPAPAPPSSRHWLGTDNQGRDVLARLIYGFRLSMLFAITLTIVSTVIGVAAGAVQGYFGGLIDLLFQRFIEVWGGLPQLFIIIIVSSIVIPGFWTLLLVLLLFSWTALVAVVRAEFLRARNFDYVRAAKALGMTDVSVMAKHVLPNAMVATITFLPFILSGAVIALTSLDFLGLGMPPGSASLGELLRQGKENLNAPWLGFTGFFAIAGMLTLLVFVGEAVRNAFDPRKNFA